MTREEAVKNLVAYAYYVDDDVPEEVAKSLDMAIAALQEEQGWIPCSERLPENAKHKGAFCPRYMVDTVYGVTQGWYNPDKESWYILAWFLNDTVFCEEMDISCVDFEKGDIPKVAKCATSNIVKAWRLMPEPYKEVDE